MFHVVFEVHIQSLYEQVKSLSIYGSWTEKVWVYSCLKVPVWVLVGPTIFLAERIVLHHVSFDSVFFLVKNFLKVNLSSLVLHEPGKLALEVAKEQDS